MTLIDRIAKDLTAAMKAKDAARTSVLRMAKAALKNREIDKGEGLDESEVVRALQGLVKQREDSVGQYEKASRPELAAKERAEIAVLKEYLPAEISEEEIAAAVEKAVEETGAASPKDMGKVMKMAMAALAGSGKADQFGDAVVVAVPAVAGSLAGRGIAVEALHLRVPVFPGRPALPGAQVVHQAAGEGVQGVRPVQRAPEHRAVAAELEVLVAGRHVGTS